MMVNEYRLTYEREWFQGFSTTAAAVVANVPRAAGSATSVMEGEPEPPNVPSILTTEWR